MAQVEKKIDLIFDDETLTIPVNPLESKLPTPTPRRSGEKAYIEDGKFEFRNSYCPTEFLDELQKFYETWLMPFVVNDYLGRSFLVGFEYFDRPKNQEYEGYHLILSIQTIY